MGEGGQKAQTSGHKMSKSWELKTPRRKTKVVAPLMDRMAIIAVNTISTYIQKLLRDVKSPHHKNKTTCNCVVTRVNYTYCGDFSTYTHIEPSHWTRETNIMLIISQFKKSFTSDFCGSRWGCRWAWAEVRASTWELRRQTHTYVHARAHTRTRTICQ